MSGVDWNTGNTGEVVLFASLINMASVESRDADHRRCRLYMAQCTIFMFYGTPHNFDSCSTAYLSQLIYIEIVWGTTKCQQNICDADRSRLWRNGNGLTRVKRFPSKWYTALYGLRERKTDRHSTFVNRKTLDDHVGKVEQKSGGFPESYIDPINVAACHGIIETRRLWTLGPMKG